MSSCLPDVMTKCAVKKKICKELKNRVRRRVQLGGRREGDALEEGDTPRGSARGEARVSVARRCLQGRCTCRAGAGCREGDGRRVMGGGRGAATAGRRPGGGLPRASGASERAWRVPAALTDPRRQGGGGRRAALSRGPRPRARLRSASRRRRRRPPVVTAAGPPGWEGAPATRGGADRAAGAPAGGAPAGSRVRSTPTLRVPGPPGRPAPPAPAQTPRTRARPAGGAGLPAGGGQSGAGRSVVASTCASSGCSSRSLNLDLPRPFSHFPQHCSSLGAGPGVAEGGRVAASGLARAAGWAGRPWELWTEGEEPSRKRPQGGLEGPASCGRT
ncbi:translation initiation factor IF-2-like [Felis catus]|uniref:translation initiation factor IF-2-like n=1 Tax=Felis catus TaxID=9685 RepID=UPI001D19A426|nr:translation initiation factor IF-2-like [Felis catus]